ncbi:squalene/phytoene synthase family protein [Thermaurantiacus sp.]
MTADPLPDLLAELKRRDPERWIVALWAPAKMRPLLAAVLLLDLELERVVAETGEPLVAEIRLAWWRDRLFDLADGRAPPAQPLLMILGSEAPAAGLDLGALAGLEDALWPLLGDGPFDLAGLAEARGRRLAAAICALADVSLPPAAEAAGARVALSRFVRRPWGRSQQAVDAGLAAWRSTAPQPRAGGPVPPVLAGLDALACRDLVAARTGKPVERPGSAGRQILIARAMLGLPFRAPPC